MALMLAQKCDHARMEVTRKPYECCQGFLGVPKISNVTGRLENKIARVVRGRLFQKIQKLNLNGDLKYLLHFAMAQPGFLQLLELFIQL